MRGALLAAAVALVAAGCGDGLSPATTVGASPAATPTSPGTTVAGATGASMLNDPGMNDISGSQAGSGVTVKVSARTPKAFQVALCARPVVVVLHQPDSPLDDALVKQVRQAAKSTKDELLLLYTPSMVREYGDLPSKLGLFAAPSVAIVARDGTIENIWLGRYIDSKLIEASLRNAAAATACKASEAGAAASAASSLQGAAALMAGGKLPAGTPAAGGLAAGTTATGVPATGVPATGVPATGTYPADATAGATSAYPATAGATGAMGATTPATGAAGTLPSNGTAAAPAAGATVPTAVGGGR